MSRLRNDECGRGDDRAVTELVSFVLVFGIIVLGVAMLSVVGFQTVHLQQDSEQTRTVYRTLETLSEDFNDILRFDGVSERDHELAAGGGRIAPGEPGPRIEVAVEHGDGTDTESWRLGSFVYEAGSRAVAYEGGGVFRTSEAGERTTLVEPRLRCTGETALISVVQIEANDRSFQSDGTASIAATETASYRETFSAVSSLEVGIDSDRPSEGGWGEVFDDWTEAGDSWTCTGLEDEVVDTLSIHVVTIDIQRSVSS